MIVFSVQVEGCLGDPRVPYSHLVYVTSLSGHWLIYHGAYHIPNLSNSIVCSKLCLDAWLPCVEYLYQVKTLEDRTF